MILYHGSNIEIEKIDLSKCRPFKDFGCGFYTTPVKEQAFAMAKRTARIFKSGTPCVTEFKCNDNLLTIPELNIKRFPDPNTEWAKFVINNRNRKFTDTQNSNCNIDNKYDVVIGPVANDDIAALIEVYLSGIVSDEALAKELTFRELSIQISFHTEKALTYLQKSGIYYA